MAELHVQLVGGEAITGSSGCTNYIPSTKSPMEDITKETQRSSSYSQQAIEINLYKGKKVTRNIFTKTHLLGYVQSYSDLNYYIHV